MPLRILLCPVLLTVYLTVVIGVARTDAEAPGVTSVTPAHASYTLPFTSLFYGAPVVQAKINDATTAVFLIDTGASTNFISQALVDKLDLKPQAAPIAKDSSFLDGKQATFVSLRKVLIGSLTLQGGAYIVMPTSDLAAGMRQEVDGVISMQMLRYFAIDLDFQRHQMTLWYPNGLDDDAVKQAGFKDAFITPLISSVPDTVLYDPTKVAESQEAYWNLYYSVPVQISDGNHMSQQRLLLDTAGGITIFPSEVSRLLSLRVQGTMPLFKPTYGSQRVNVVKASSLQIGDLRLHNQTANVFQVAATGEDSANKMAALGLDVLSGYRILIDFGAKKMYLKPDIPQIRIGAPQDKRP